MQGAAKQHDHYRCPFCDYSSLVTFRKYHTRKKIRRFGDSKELTYFCEKQKRLFKITLVGKDQRILKKPEPLTKPYFNKDVLPDDLDLFEEWEVDDLIQGHKGNR